MDDLLKDEVDQGNRRGAKLGVWIPSHVRSSSLPKAANGLDLVDITSFTTCLVEASLYCILQPYGTPLRGFLMNNHTATMLTRRMAQFDQQSDTRPTLATRCLTENARGASCHASVSTTPPRSISLTVKSLRCMVLVNHVPRALSEHENGLCFLRTSS